MSNGQESRQPDEPDQQPHTPPEQWRPGKLIEAARRGRGWNRAEAADRCGYSEEWWRDIERGWKRVTSGPRKGAYRVSRSPYALTLAAVTVGTDARAVLSAAHLPADEIDRLTQAVDNQLPDLCDRIKDFHNFLDGWVANDPAAQEAAETARAALANLLEVGKARQRRTAEK